MFLKVFATPEYIFIKYIYILYVRFTAAVARDSASSALFGRVAVLLEHNLTCYSTNTNSELDWTYTGL